MRYLQAAFDAATPDATLVDSWFVSLVERSRYYGGPEEGGWWGTDTNLVAFREYPTEKLARAAQLHIVKLADEMQQHSRREHGQHCLATMEWLDARGLDADYLPEPDGPSEFDVIVTQGEPAREYRGTRQYS